MEENVVKPIDTVVIGAGHAGLSASRALQLEGVEHVVLERGRVGETWRNQRWESFRLNTPGFINKLVDGPEFGDGFGSTTDLLSYFERYIEKFGLPVVEQTNVERVEPVDGDYLVQTDADTFRARHIVVCSGVQNVPVTPAMSESLSADIAQLHSADYRSADDLAGGAVLVVGAGQSGAQIAEDLAEAGRDVHLCTSKVGRAPRRYRGRDLLEWVFNSPAAKMRAEDLPDPAMRYAKQARISGTNGGHTLCLHQLARDGVTLLGRLESVDGTHAKIGGDLIENVEFADGASRHIRGMLDQMIAMSGVDAPAAEPDPTEEPFDMIAMGEIRELDLEEAGITTVIWATGFCGELDYFELDLRIDEHGEPAHDDGVSPVDGIYFLGLPWLRNRASGLIAGATDDARHVATQIAARRADRKAG